MLLYDLLWYIDLYKRNIKMVFKNLQNKSDLRVIKHSQRQLLLKNDKNKKQNQFEDKSSIRKIHQNLSNYGKKYSSVLSRNKLVSKLKTICSHFERNTWRDRECCQHF